MTADERLALRVGALRRARHRQRIGEGAWAASRLRLRSVALERSDAAFARDAIVRFGRMIRVARSRRPTAPSVTAIVPPPLAHAASRARRVAVVVALAVVVVVMLLWVPSRPSEEAVRPLPSELATPPVTKMCLATGSQGIAASRPDGRCPQPFGRSLVASPELVEHPQRCH